MLPYVQDFSRTFTFFEECWLLWCFHLLPLEKEIIKELNSNTHSWTWKGWYILKLTSLQREGTYSKGISGKRFKSLRVTYNPLLIPGPHNCILTFAPFTQDRVQCIDVHWQGSLIFNQQNLQIHGFPTWIFCSYFVCIDSACKRGSTNIQGFSCEYISVNTDQQLCYGNNYLISRHLPLFHCCSSLCHIL